MKQITIVISLFLLICVASAIISKRPQKDNYYKGKFSEYKDDFYYFTNIRARFFEKSKARSYTAVYTIRENLYLLCASNNTSVDSQCNSDFLTKEEIERAKKFMEGAKLHVIVYTLYSVDFVFDGSLKKISYYDNFGIRHSPIDKAFFLSNETKE